MLLQICRQPARDKVARETTERILHRQPPDARGRQHFPPWQGSSAAPDGRNFRRLGDFGSFMAPGRNQRKFGLIDLWHLLRLVAKPRPEEHTPPYPKPPEGEER